MKVIKFSYELPVSTENEPVIAIVAKELGYDGVIGTPEEYIEKHFNNFFTDLRAKVESGLKRHYGEAGIEELTKTIQNVSELELEQAEIDLQIKHATLRKQILEVTVALNNIQHEKTRRSTPAEVPVVTKKMPLPDLPVDPAEETGCDGCQ